MALQFADRVRETTATTGTGTITLGGAVSGFQTFAGAIPDGSQVAYTIEDGANWECGIGTYAQGSNTLSRAAVEASSSASNPITLSGTAQVYVSFTAGALGQVAPAINIPRNKLVTPFFFPQQRGLGPWTAAGYTADMWKLDPGAGGGSRSVSILAMSDADRAAIGDERAYNTLQYTWNGGSGLNDFDSIRSPIENVYALSNQWAVLSFWAKLVSGTGVKLAMEAYQDFGTGGSPSATVHNTGTRTVTLSNSWSRYYIPVFVASLAGKVIGTNGNSALWVRVWFSSGTANNAIAGSIGVQNGVVQLWGMQFEYGTTPSPIEVQDGILTLARAQRYYQTGRLVAASSVSASGITCAGYSSFATLMHAVPTLSITSDSSVGVLGARGLQASSPSGVSGSAVSNAAGGWILDLTWAASAELA
jgi:hypothetical protein